MRRIRLLALGVVTTGCPYDPKVVDPGEITETDSDTDTTMGSLTEPTESGDPTTSPSTTVDPSDPDTGTTNPSGDCGDGEVEGDEVCDDMVNDGAYGGCLPDCSDFAERCGDGEVNGPEACDDEVNDGAYGGCASDCSALGPHCGDGEMNGPEGCDNGDANENGTGCNLDCIISGTQLGTYDDGPFSFCDGNFITKPTFRDGNTLVAATGYCGVDDQVLLALNADVTLNQMYDVLLPETPVREATVAGDLWVLGANGCNYVVDAAGVLTEVCEARTAGTEALEADESGNYAALDYDVLALYPAGSPTAGDSPTWVNMPQDNGSYDYSFAGATFGAAGSVAVVGSRRLISNSTNVGFVARYTAAGNLAGNYTFPDVQYFEDAVHAPDGTVLAISNYPSYSVTKLDANYAAEWSLPTGSDLDLAAGIDSTGALVLLYRDASTTEYRMLKRASDGATLWDQSVTGLGYEYRMGIAPDDSIWIADVVYVDPEGYHVTVMKFAP